MENFTDKTKLYLTDGNTKYCILYSFKTHHTKKKICFHVNLMAKLSLI